MLLRNLQTLFLSVLCIVSCSKADSPLPADADGGETQSCRSGCEASIWPRLILGIAGGAADAVRRAVAVDPAGESIPGLPGGCPRELGMPCSFSWITGPATTELQLNVALSDDRRFEASIPLRPHNYCGREIAYVALDLASEQAEIQPPKYVSPCQAVSGEGDLRSD